MLFRFFLFCILLNQTLERKVGGKPVKDTFPVSADLLSGLFIWRVEDFSPVPWDPSLYGSFHTGDSYLILSTKNVSNKIVRDLHFWLGNQTSQDEAGSAAILTVMLDDVLGGGATQHREVQYEESNLFQSYFISGLNYLPGGVKSGFTFVKDLVAEKRLFLVKGRRNVHAVQTVVDISSLNRFDAFILDCGKGNGVMIFRPRGANRFEKIKATAVANDIKNEDHAGKGRVEMFDESENDDMTRFFAALGSGSISEVSILETNDNDFEYTPKLYRIFGNTYSPVMGPLNQNLFLANSTYIFTPGVNTNFLWFGRYTSKELRKESVDVLKSYLRDKGIDQNVAFEEVVEGLETATFKQFFPEWKEIIDTKSWKSSIGKPLKSSPTFSGPPTINSEPKWSIRDLHLKKLRKLSKLKRDQFMQNDDGRGQTTIWRVENFNLVGITNTPLNGLMNNSTL